MQLFKIVYPKLNNSERFEQEKGYIFLSQVSTLTINAEIQIIIDLY